MSYALTKSLWSFLQPSSLIAIMLGISLILASFSRWPRLGFRMAWTALSLLLACGLLPLANVLILPLEQRFPATHGKLPEEPIAGILLLGGYEDGRISAARGSLTLNEAAERLTEAAVLAHRLPDAQLIITGGAGVILREDREATTEIAAFLTSIGVAAERIVIERRSTTTSENARFARDLVKPRPGQRWLLVTSAAHMPRAVGTFRHQGFDVIAWPVDYRTKDAGDLLRPFGSIAGGLRRMDEATQEWVGLFAYRALGRTTELFPAP